jgi:alpha-galactosidase
LHDVGDQGTAVKLVAIGIGSVIFGIELLRDVFRVPEFRGGELWLVDTDAAALARMTGLADRLNAAADWQMTIHATRDRLEALAGADFVVTAAAVDRIATWRIDHDLALSHGFASVLSENGGPGGLSHTLRSIPLMLEIGRDIEALAPNAVLFSYTNPANRVCLALHRYTTVRAVGLCHSLAEAIDACARVLGRPRDTIDAVAAGVNHFTWFVSVRDRVDGSDLMPELRRRTLAGDPEQAPLRRRLIEQLGSFPAIDDDHVGEYLPWAAALIGTAGYDFERHDRRSLADIDMLEAWGSGARPVDPLLAEPSQEAMIDHSAADTMGALISGRTLPRPSFILPNDGYIDDLPLDSVIEVPGLVEDGVARGVSVGALPEQVAALVRHELAIQDAAVQAAIEGSRDLAMRALLLDPLVTDVQVAERFLDAILDAHRAYLPRFWS